MSAIETATQTVVDPFEVDSPELSRWARLWCSHQWASLTERQKSWVAFFCTSGSALDATRLAYKVKSDANARVLSYELKRNPTITAAVDLANGKVKTERELLLQDVRAQLKFAERGSIAAAKLMALRTRLTLDEPEQTEPDEPDDEASAAIAGSESRIPPGATALADDQGVVRGYRTSDGDYVQLADVGAV